MIKLMDDTKSLTEILNDTSNGLGTIQPIKATCVEELNGSYEVEFTVPVSDQKYSLIHCNGIIKTLANDSTEEQMFRIYGMSKPMNGIVTVSARHITYDLNKAAVKPFSTTGAVSALNGLKSHLLGDYEFDVYTDIDNAESKFKLDTPISFRNALGGVEGSILDVFGGEYEWDNLTVKLHAHRGQDNGVTIEYGKNLTDFRQEENIENTYNAVLGYATVNEETYTGDVQLAADVTAPKTQIVDFSSEFEGEKVPTVEALNELAKKYIKNNNIGVPNVNIEVKFVPLWQTDEYKSIAPLERVKLGDTVHVNFPKMGVSTTAKVIRTEYNIVKGRYDSIEIGNVRSNLGSKISQLSTQVNNAVPSMKSILEAAIAHATTLLKGGLGGHVVINTNANGEPNEILIMDTDNIATAVNVIRMNMNGIGFSNDGYNGTYRTAWTIDGGFNASFINSGTINANLIRSGVITSDDGSNYWNLKSGEFYNAIMKDVTVKTQNYILNPLLTIRSGETVPDLWGIIGSDTAEVVNDSEMGVCWHFVSTTEKCGARNNAGVFMINQPVSKVYVGATVKVVQSGFYSELGYKVRAQLTVVFSDNKATTLYSEAYVSDLNVAENVIFAFDVDETKTIKYIDAGFYNTFSSKKTTTQETYYADMWCSFVNVSTYGDYTIEATATGYTTSTINYTSKTKNGHVIMNSEKVELVGTNIEGSTVKGSEIVFAPDGAYAVTAKPSSLGSNGGVLFTGDGDFTVETATIGLTGKGTSDGVQQVQIVGYDGNGGLRNLIQMTDVGMYLHFIGSSHSIWIVMNDNDGLKIDIDGVGYSNLGWVNDGNGHVVLGK